MTQVEHAWAKIRRQEYAAASKDLGVLRGLYPRHRDVLYLLAVSLRCLGRLSEALEVLEELEQHHSMYARVFEERGLCHVAQGAAEAAIMALSKAVTLNPWLPVSWSALHTLYRQCERPHDAAAAARCRAALERLPGAVRTALILFADGEIDAAELLVRKYLREHGAHIEGLRLLARIAMMHDEAHDAEIILEKVLKVAPEYYAARYEYALALLEQRKHRVARQELERLLAADADNHAYRVAYATACARLGDLEQSIVAYRQLASREPGAPEAHLAIGHALKSLGRSGEASQSYRVAASLRSGYAAACWHLAALREFRFDDAELERMIHEESDAGTAQVDRYHLCFAVGKALEGRGEYAQSFRYYERGNALKKRECAYRAEMVEEIARRKITTCTPEFFAARQGWGCPDAAPIFIVGLPRAGSTLIEQILASHSEVDATMELPNISLLVRERNKHVHAPDDARYPGALGELTRDECMRLGERYIRETLEYRLGKRFFVDKWPDNFHDLGFIHLILPNARIVDARRDPMACCFGIFKQLFPSGAGAEFAYSFEDIAGYYRIYLELMRHWDAVLPGKILRIQHEELVTKFSATVRRLLEFCDLRPEPACLEFHKTERAVYTLSAEQVRQPINRDSMCQWRHFEPWLGPLQAALMKLGVATREGPVPRSSNELMQATVGNCAHRHGESTGAVRGDTIGPAGGHPC